MINWDPEAKTALSNEEVIYKEARSKLYFVRYLLEDGSDSPTIATTVRKRSQVILLSVFIRMMSDTVTDREESIGAHRQQTDPCYCRYLRGP